MLLFLAKIQESFSLDKALTNYIFTSGKCEDRKYLNRKGRNTFVVQNIAIGYRLGVFLLLECHFTSFEQKLLQQTMKKVVYIQP